MITRNSLKRKESIGLVANTSPFHAAVTLFDAVTEDVVRPSTSRRSKRIKLEDDTEIILDLEEAIQNKPKLKTEDEKPDVSPAKSKGKAMKARKAKPIPQSLETPHPAPPRWKETWDIIKDMRSNIVAPVDTMGCDQAQLREKDPKSKRFTTLVSLMLSSQTKDEVTDAAVSRLRAAVGGSLTVDAIRGADENTISEAIAKVGFWRRKTQYIKQTAQVLHDKFDSDVPKTVDELCSLPGVGPKMAFLVLQVAWNLNVGIGVDVHVHRITNRLGWHKTPTKNPEETRLNLQSWLPTELHPEINHMLVGFGQTVCLPVGPRCDVCKLGPTGLCPSARKVVSGKSKGSKKMTTIVSSELSGPKVEVAVETDIKTEVSVAAVAEN